MIVYAPMPNVLIANFFPRACIGKGTRNVRKTPGGLIFCQRWNNLQFVTSSSFLAAVYSDYLTSSGKSLKCAQGTVAPSQLVAFAKSQVDYIIGDNPRATSYMVGYGTNFPKQVHHRGSSIVSIKVNPSFVSRRGGYATWFSRKGSDPNLLVGAIVGGPDASRVRTFILLQPRTSQFQATFWCKQIYLE